MRIATSATSLPDEKAECHGGRLHGRGQSKGHGEVHVGGQKRESNWMESTHSSPEPTRHAPRSTFLTPVPTKKSTPQRRPKLSKPPIQIKSNQIFRLQNLPHSRTANPGPSHYQHQPKLCTSIPAKIVHLHSTTRVYQFLPLSSQTRLLTSPFFFISNPNQQSAVPSTNRPRTNPQPSCSTPNFSLLPT